MTTPERFPLLGTQTGAVDAYGMVTAAGTVPVLLRIKGRLSTDEIYAALAAVVRHHSALRTVIGGMGRFSYQRVTELVDVERCVPFVDWRRAKTTDVRLTRMMSEALAAPFDLSQAPLMRGSLIRVGDTEWVLWLLSGVIADAASGDIIAEDLASALGGEELADTLQLGPYAAQKAESVPTGAELAFWRTQYRGRGGLPARWLKPAGLNTVAVPTYEPELVGQLDDLCDTYGLSITSVFAALAGVTSRALDGHDLMVGCHEDGRDPEEIVGGNQRTVGPLADHLPVHPEVRWDESFEELVVEVSARHDEAKDYRTGSGRLQGIVKAAPFDLALRVNRVAASPELIEVAGDDEATVEVVRVHETAPVSLLRATNVAPMRTCTMERTPDGGMTGVLTGVDARFTYANLTDFAATMYAITCVVAANPAQALKYIK